MAGAIGSWTKKSAVHLLVRAMLAIFETVRPRSVGSSICPRSAVLQMRTMRRDLRWRMISS